MGAKRQQSVGHGLHQAAPADESRLLPKADNTFEKSRRDGGIRTRDLLLPNQLPPAAGRASISPHMASTSNDAR